MSGAFRRFGPESPFDDPFGHMRATARSFLGHTTSRSVDSRISRLVHRPEPTDPWTSPDASTRRRSCRPSFAVAAEHRLAHRAQGEACVPPAGGGRSAFASASADVDRRNARPRRAALADHARGRRRSQSTDLSATAMSSARREHHSRLRSPFRAAGAVRESTTSRGVPGGRERGSAGSHAVQPGEEMGAVAVSLAGRAGEDGAFDGGCRWSTLPKAVSTSRRRASMPRTASGSTALSA